MASGVEELLDMLFDMVDEAKNVPLSSDKCMIERDRALDLIDDIRAQFPVELSEAKKLMASRADMIASAKREADAIRRQAGLLPVPSAGPGGGAARQHQGQKSKKSQRGTFLHRCISFLRVRSLCASSPPQGQERTKTPPPETTKLDRAFFVSASEP